MNYSTPCVVFSNFFLVLGLVLLMFVDQDESFILTWNVLDMKTCSLDVSFMLDWISILFFSVLCMIVSCVLKFSKVYMADEPYPNRFLGMLLCFVLSMFFLIFIPHFFFLLLGWDGLGLTSFLLVMYYSSKSSWAAGMKTFLMNRMGDGFFIIALVLLFSGGKWDMTGLKGLPYSAMMFMMLGCFTKSAQFPFCSWLPAAMAAPTPVSALVHSSTLVTAGMYVMIRICYSMPPSLFMFMGLVGLWTLYGASFAACVEWDAKKVMAYSTLSQLGLMTVCMSLNHPLLAFYHLMTHALFKAMMFMCMGYYMINCNHMQDLRHLKGMWRSAPLMSMTLFVGCLSLMGFPFLSGFYSKDAIMEGDLFVFNQLFHKLLLLSLPLTSYYSTRLMLQMFVGNKFPALSLKSDKNVCWGSVLPLYVGTMFSGKMLSEFFVSSDCLLACGLLKMYMLLLVSSGFILACLKVKFKNRRTLWFFSEMNFMSPFKGVYWINKLVDTGEVLHRYLDQGLLSKTMYDGAKSLLSSGSLLSKIYSYFSNPKLEYYVMSIMVLMMCLILVLV